MSGIKRSFTLKTRPPDTDPAPGTAGSPSGETLLTVRGLTVRFGGVTALEDVSLQVRSGEICALIGPNGAGKTTAFNSVSRLVQPVAGAIAFDGADLLRARAGDLAALGIARTFQNLALWPGLTVIENVMVGAHSLGRTGFLGAPFGWGVRSEHRELTERAYAALAVLAIQDVAFQPCQGLPFGTLRRVELARALVTRPRLLMLDEPAAGLTQGDVRDLGTLLRALRDELGLSLLLVEHHMQLVMDIADYVVVLDSGRNLLSGRPDEIRDDPRLVEAYLGSPR
ncbi:MULTISPECIES: ABC transporter ATP-binding protein [Nonomuraea]|uniref:ABC transporter ATP-binding protein n=1 Tax=Nonomuraea harbinensis TaxID=1286938 RepID=A0ABW1BYW4_9ACTN|nr:MULTISPECIES: ABC transporter ATP-binding protein [Nonomuraea]TXK38964.1 ABC transporter ATP-binding protein [Nonomuraea sp. C10]